MLFEIGEQKSNGGITNNTGYKGCNDDIGYVFGRGGDNGPCFIEFQERCSKYRRE